MNIKPIRNNADLSAAFEQLEVIFQAQAGTPEFDEMEFLVTLIEAYERAIGFFQSGEKMTQQASAS